MKLKISLKRPIIIGIITLAALLLALGLFLFLRPRKPDPEALFLKADRLTEQNLCLMALLEEHPEEEAHWRTLLTNYRLLGADPLTLQGTLDASGLDLTLPEVSPQKEPTRPLAEVGGIRRKGQVIKKYDCSAIASDGETLYLARPEGIYACWQGLERKIAPAKAERMIPGENGLYFLNATAKRVQYVARDGHRIETLSPIPAKDFAFLKEQLWIVGTDGTLYQGTEELQCNLQELCLMGDTLYAASEDGIYRIENGTLTLLLPSPASALTAGKEVLYYIDENGYPAQFDPTAMEAKILKEKTATALTFDQGKLYYLNLKGKIRSI